MGAGSDLAVENADIVIVKGGVSRVADAISLSRRIFEVIRQNLFWAFARRLLHPPPHRRRIQFSRIPPPIRVPPRAAAGATQD